MLEAKIEDGHLVVRVPMQTPKPSATGKTLVVATTGGNQALTTTEDGKAAIYVGVNAYVKP